MYVQRIENSPLLLLETRKMRPKCSSSPNAAAVFAYLTDHRPPPPPPPGGRKCVYPDSQEYDGSFWNRGINAFKKLREWSKIVAGPRWKAFICRFNRTKSGGGVKRSAEFQYDPLSYFLNFDRGPGNNDISDQDDDFRFRNLSSRYATTPSLQNKGLTEIGKNGHNLV